MSNPLQEWTIKQIEKDHGKTGQNETVSRETFTVNGVVTPKFYIDIGFPFGARFTWIPGKGDSFKDFVKWLFHVKHNQPVLYRGLSFEGAYIH